MTRTRYTAVIRHADGREVRAVAYAMNSAIRRTEALVREHAREVGSPFIGETPARDGDVYMRRWVSGNGTAITAWAHPRVSCAGRTSRGGARSGRGSSAASPHERPGGGIMPTTRTRTVTYSRKRTRHGRHALATLATGGAWLVVWWPLAAWRAFGPRRRTVTVTTVRAW